MINEKYSTLINEAIKARKKSYCPYSHFAVGASLLSADGTVFTGANIENSSYTPTVCAERVAFFEAIHKGHRNFSAIAIVGGKDGEEISDFCPPCGVCRQVMSEFCDGDFEIILSDGKEDKVFTLDKLMPCRFDLLK
jgi:cytidine deaminase